MICVALNNGRSFFIQNYRTGCLCVHGLTGSPEVFHEMGEYLSKHHIKMSVPCLPGHNTTVDDLRKKSWQKWFHCAELAYRELASCCDKVFLTGLSMGGTLALLLSSRYPIDGVVTIAAPIQLKWWQGVFIPLVKPVIPDWKKRWDRFEQVASLKNTYDRYPLEAIQQLIELCKITRTELGNLTCPVLILHGKEDKRVRFKNAEMIYRMIGSNNKNLITFPVTQHVLFNSPKKADVFNEIYRFIRQNDQGELDV